MAKQLSDGLLTRGFVLDGFPRTRGQAQGLDRFLARRQRPLDGVVYLPTPQAVLVTRLSGRQVCNRCGANYHPKTMPPRRAGQCDRCRIPLTVRKDDQPRTIKRRLAVDRRAVKPLLAYYRAQGVLHRVNGEGRIEDVFARARAVFRQHGWLGAGATRRSR
jgi:adenylate kinase